MHTHISTYITDESGLQQSIQILTAETKLRLQYTKAVYPLVRSRSRLRCASVLVMRPHSHSMTRQVAK